MSEIAEQLAEALEASTARKRVEQRAQEADVLEMDLAFERAEIPDNSLGRAFRERLYEGKADPSEVRIAWADLLDRDEFLTIPEQLRRELRRHRKETTNAHP